MGEVWQRGPPPSPLSPSPRPAAQPVGAPCPAALLASKPGPKNAAPQPPSPRADPPAARLVGEGLPGKLRAPEGDALRGHLHGESPSSGTCWATGLGRPPEPPRAPGGAGAPPAVRVGVRGG